MGIFVMGKATRATVDNRLKSGHAGFGFASEPRYCKHYLAVPRCRFLSSTASKIFE